MDVNTGEEQKVEKTGGDPQASGWTPADVSRAPEGNQLLSALVCLSAKLDVITAHVTPLSHQQKCHHLPDAPAQPEARTRPGLKMSPELKIRPGLGIQKKHQCL
ncbi:hypothetical protein Celaphus_00015630 [Cervus elaphus hippelaphus]|uniref:Uncharacterized protein n=1 Tax=Cervus elaphus hippelaphus TaxID=46360 RepID=A0A212C1S2_CEREH|nr:hypothetical protein Celaphus_00015630 [Cervus elaphus hippelaphus]